MYEIIATNAEEAAEIRSELEDSYPTEVLNLITNYVEAEVDTDYYPVYCDPQQAMSLEEVLQHDHETCKILLANGCSRNTYIEVSSGRLGLWKESAIGGNDQGQLLYGLCFFYGHGEEEDEPTAIEWFRKSADQGNAQSLYTLSLCYQNGWGVEADYKTAVEWYSAAESCFDDDERHFPPLPPK